MCLKKTLEKRGERMNKSKLESVMKLHKDNGQTLADYLGIARQTFSSKINETRGAEFTQGEIMLIKEKYNLSPAEIDDIFFDSKVSKKDTNTEQA